MLFRSLIGTEYVLANTAMTAITAPAPAQSSHPASRHMACSQENSLIKAGAIHTQHGIQETGASSSPKHAVTHRAATSCPRRWQRSTSSSAGTASTAPASHAACADHGATRSLA